MAKKQTELSDDERFRRTVERFLKTPPKPHKDSTKADKPKGGKKPLAD